MHVRVLGEFAVTRSGVEMTPSAPKLRQVFALLAVEMNRAVRTDQLIEELWEDRPPLSAVTTLQTYIYQLRKLLCWSEAAVGPAAAACDGVALRTTPGGYVLRLPEDALDSVRFERGVSAGREQLAAGRFEQAAGTLRQALELWTGRAFGAVSPGPLLHAQLVRLEEMRKLALDHRIEADLRLGRHIDLIGELTTLVAQQPTHEGFQAKLMLGLYRAGRRAEALQAYQRARTALSDELGLEPSAELRRLHQAMLAADPSLDAPPQVPGTVRPAARHRRPPNQLPMVAGQLLGRERQLDDVCRALAGHGRATPAVALAVGAPGSGKSAFAVHVAHRVRACYPDGVLFAALQRPDGSVVPAAEVLGGFLRALGLSHGREGACPEEAQAAFRAWTAHRRLLVVLDDVVDAQQISALLPGPGSAVVAVGRRMLWHPAVVVTARTGPLGEEACHGMLAGALGADRLAADGDRLGELVTLSGGLPMPLQTAANLLQLRPHWPVAKLLAAASGDVRRIPPAAVGAPGLADSVARSVRLLPGAGQAAFRTVAGAAEPFVSVARAAQLLEVDEAQAELLLEDLVEYQLAEAEDVGGVLRYSVRPPIRGIAASLAAPAAGVPLRRRLPVAPSGDGSAPLELAPTAAGWA
ncbi:BTAD domain-containing putative transcriptional regulator [Streptomyces gamaensis]|uniref:BTAD domain-containing putative transcriptional regulator n=1 Tax=Streptomyces gamaensis TaxID=1763542 RepID=A0ABW0Z6C5_9ACTN